MWALLALDPGVCCLPMSRSLHCPLVSIPLLNFLGFLSCLQYTLKLLCFCFFVKCNVASGMTIMYRWTVGQTMANYSTLDRQGVAQRSVAVPALCVLQLSVSLPWPRTRTQHYVDIQIFLAFLQSFHRPGLYPVQWLFVARHQRLDLGVDRYVVPSSSGSWPCV